MTDAALMVLTAPQAVMLRMAVAAGRDGREAAGYDPVLCALARRQLVEAMPIHPGGNRRARHRFVATLAGRAWVRDADAREGLRPAERTTPSRPWNGTAAEGSRWTAEQAATLRKSEVGDPERCAVATVTRRAGLHEQDWTEPTPVIRVDVPCLATTHGRTRGKVIYPDGSIGWQNIVALRGPGRG